jgi:ABC-type thiamin/hydroxymethylpyrimidine transport system permease subunit
MKSSVRELVYVAIFGAIWGALELTLGSYLHVIFPPLADTFLVGLLMASLGAIVALIGRRFVPRTGSVFMISVVAAILKMISIGGVTVGPLVAILAEGLLMELGLIIARRPTRWAFVFAGALAVAWNFFHKFIMMYILFGKGAYEVYVGMVQQGASLLRIDLSYALLIIVILFLIRIVAGAVSGWIAWDLARVVHDRLAR